jgi:hypothetical protein
MDKHARFIFLADETIATIDGFMEGVWTDYRETVVKEKISLLGDQE